MVHPDASPCTLLQDQQQHSQAAVVELLALLGIDHGGGVGVGGQRGEHRQHELWVYARHMPTVPHVWWTITLEVLLNHSSISMLVTFMC